MQKNFGGLHIEFWMLTSISLILIPQMRLIMVEAGTFRRLSNFLEKVFDAENNYDSKSLPLFQRNNYYITSLASVRCGVNKLVIVRSHGDVNETK